MTKQARIPTRDAGVEQNWVWITAPEFYAEPDGSDRQDLDPGDPDAGGWWTCHKDTQKGDLVMLYRTSPQKDLKYLIQATSDAYSIADDRFARRRGWDYACDYQVLFKVENPLRLSDLRADPYLSDWGPVKANFRRRVYAVSEPVWQTLIKRTKSRNTSFQTFFEGGIQRGSNSIMLEEELEQRLADDPSVLRKFGYDIEIRDRQLICAGHGGRIDLLGFDKKRNRYVVIELKNVRAGQNTFGQIATYLGWAKQRISKGRLVDGLVIARGFDTRFLTAAATNPRVGHLDLEELDFR